ncbi:hypothetical protein ACQRET_03235 [Streptomyces koyangensis]|uniref:hypothetical protein n=1 Tax=Streptomyces koyangensis TaxID=188770 RepID=UPI003D04114A
MATDAHLHTSGVLVCSLKRDTPQVIPSGGYHIVRFPFGVLESYDRWEMHQVQQPDGYTITSWDTDQRSGLIWPTTTGWGELHAMVQWESGDYVELRDQYVRDPLSLGSPTPVDTTATEHRPPSIGMQCWVKGGHGIFVRPDTPLALRVAHDAPNPTAVVLAEFKLVIHQSAP